MGVRQRSRHQGDDRVWIWSRCARRRESNWWTCRGAAALTSPRLDIAVAFADGANLILVDEKVRFSLAGEPDHAVVEVFNPAVDSLAVAKLDRDRDLLLAQEAQIQGFLSSFSRWRAFSTLPRWTLERHCK